MIATGTWPGFVARVATPATPSEIAEDVAEGYEVEIGGEAPGGIVLAVTAQGLLETATREDPNHDGITTREEQAPGFWNGNLGNIRGTYLIDGVACWTSFRAGEGHGAGAVTLEPGPANRFRSYIGPHADPTDPKVLRRARQRGARDMLALLQRRYPLALLAAERRDFRGYVHELHAKGYFTADETMYGNAEDRLRLTLEHLPQVAAYLKGAT